LPTRLLLILIKLFGLHMAHLFLEVVIVVRRSPLLVPRQDSLRPVPSSPFFCFAVVAFGSISCANRSAQILRRSPGQTGGFVKLFQGVQVIVRSFATFGTFRRYREVSPVAVVGIFAMSEVVWRKRRRHGTALHHIASRVQRGKLSNGKRLCDEKIT